MILASAIVADLEFLVDDENSERYGFDKDYKPAINGAVRYIMSAFDQAFERGILSPTIFGELLFGEKISPSAIVGLDASKVIVTFASIWRLVGVDPFPIFATDDYVGPSKGLAKYLTFDKAGNPEEDPFEAGSPQSTDVAQYSFTSLHTDASNTILVVRPELDGDCGVVYLKIPTIVTLTSSEIEFPYVLYQPLLMKAYQLLLIQVGSAAATGLQVSDKEVKELTSLFI